MALLYKCLVFDMLTLKIINHNKNIKQVYLYILYMYMYIYICLYCGVGLYFKWFGTKCYRHACIPKPSLAYGYLLLTLHKALEPMRAPYWT